MHVQILRHSLKFLSPVDHYAVIRVVRGIHDREFVGFWSPSTMKSALIHYSREGDLDMVNTLLNQGVSVEDADIAVYNAAVNGYADILTLLLSYGAPIPQDEVKPMEEYEGFLYKKNDNLIFPTTLERGHVACFCALLSKSPSVDRGILGMCFTYAARLGDLELLRWLQEKGAQIDDVMIYNHAADVDIGWMTQHYGALKYASSEGHIEVVRYLVEIGETWEYCEAMAKAVENGHSEIIEYLLSTRDHDETMILYALLMAASKGMFAFVQRLIRIKPALISNKMPLFYAAAHGHLNVVQFYVSSQKVKIPHEVIKRAAARGHLGVVRFLMSKGVDSQHVFEIACSEGHVDIVTFMLNQTGRLQKRKVALVAGYLEAVDEGRADVVDLIHQKRSFPQDVYVKAFRLAAERSDLNIMRLVDEIAKGVDVNTLSDDSCRIIGCVGDWNVVQYLLKKGICLQKIHMVMKGSIERGKVASTRGILMHLRLDSIRQNQMDYLTCAVGNRHLSIVKILHNYFSYTYKECVDAAMCSILWSYGDSDVKMKGLSIVKYYVESHHVCAQELIKTTESIQNEMCLNYLAMTTLFEKAARENRIDVVKKWLFVRGVDAFYCNAVLTTVKSGNKGLLDLFFTKEVIFTDATLLHDIVMYLCETGDLDMLKYVGTKVSLSRETLKEGLCVACKNRFIDIVRYLVGNADTVLDDLDVYVKCAVDDVDTLDYVIEHMLLKN